MFKLEGLPEYQLAGPAGTDYQKLVALVDAYVKASNEAYVQTVTEPDKFVAKQQTVIALGRALREGLAQVTRR